MLNNILPEYKSYIIGFLQGDGHHREESRNRGEISVELSKRDEDILNKIYVIINDYCFVSKKSRVRDTNFKDNFESCSIALYNKDIRTELKRFIPVGKKVYSIMPPSNTTPEHYIRGLTDADGSIGMTSNNRPFWSLCTSAEGIKEFVIRHIKKVIGVEKRLNRTKRDNNYNIILCDEDALFYTKLLYSSATLYLDRKYNKYLEIQNWTRNTPKRKGRQKRWLPYEDTIILSNTTLDKKCLLLNRTKPSIKTRLWRLKQ